MREAEELVEALTTRYGYDRVSLLDRAETEAALGTRFFAGAINDRGGGHLDPLRFALGLAKAAASLGATLHEDTPATALRHEGGRHIVATPRGDITADHVIVATDGRSGSFETTTRRRMVGINSFIVVTEPLGSEGDAFLPGAESAADSRFVVRYWRKTPDGRVLFGGGEIECREDSRRHRLVREAAPGRNLSAARQGADRPRLGRCRLGHRPAPALCAGDQAVGLGGRRLFRAGRGAGALHRQAAGGGGAGPGRSG